MRAHKIFIFLIAAALLAPGCATHEHARPTVVLLTDFGMKDDAVALLRGAVLSVARQAQVVDLTHEVPPYDIEEGARLLEEAPGLFPPGTVFVAVVDPGVGTARRPIAIELANGSFLVGPDNGVLSLAAARYGVREAWTIDDRRFMRETVSRTFHGRDVFAPAAAHLAAGRPPKEEIGRDVAPGSLVRLTPRAATLTAAGLESVVLTIDEPYGNIWTNIGPADLGKLGERVEIVKFRLAAAEVLAPLVTTFGDVPKGAPLAYWNSRGKLALAINQGDARREYHAWRGESVVVSREK